MVPDLIERAAVEAEAFNWFASRLKTQQGNQLILEPFQQELLTPTLAGVRVNVIELPKKLGKSTLVAAYAVYHLMTTPLADVIVIASAVKQADILYGHIRKFIASNPQLSEELVVKPGFKEVRLRDQPLAKIRVLTNDAQTLEGVEPTLAILDEFHTYTSAEPYAICRDGIDTRDGQLIVITNAGQDEMSPFGQMRAMAMDLPVREDRGAYKMRTNGERTFVYQEYSLDPDADVTDMAVVKTANPASWMTEKALRERYEDPGETLQRFKRFACGIWVRSEDTAISPEEWDALEDQRMVIPKGSPVWIGWDCAFRGPDTTALVPLWWKDNDHRVFGTPTVLQAPMEGMLDDREIVNALLEFEKEYSIEGIVFDPNAGAAALAQQLERDHGWKLIEHSQKGSTLAKADVRFLEAVRQKTIVHNGDPIFRNHVLNAVERSTGTDGSWIFDRPKHGRRVPTDALRAASLVHNTALAAARKRPAPTPIFYRI